MLDEVPFSFRVGREEWFIAAPNDSVHIRAFQSVCPQAAYDAILEEWRVSWDGREIEEIFSDLDQAIEKFESTQQSFNLTAGKKFGYAQVAEGEGPEDQIDQLRDIGIDDELIYLDRLTGRDPERPKFDECLKQLKEGDLLYVWNFNRVARSLKQLSDSLNDILERGAHVYSIDEEIDTRDSKFQYFAEFVEYAKDFEIEANRIRTKAGIRAAHKRGRVGGRKKSITKEQLELIVRLVLKGMNASAIAEIAGTSRSTIYRVFPNGIAGIQEAYEQGGQEAIDDLINSVAGPKRNESYTALREKVLILSKTERLSANEIADRTGLNRETVRRYIREDG